MFQEEKFTFITCDGGASLTSRTTRQRMEEKLKGNWTEKLRKIVMKDNRDNQGGRKVSKVVNN